MVNDALQPICEQVLDSEAGQAESEKKNYLEYIRKHRFENIALSCDLSGGEYSKNTINKYRMDDEKFKADMDEILKDNADINVANLVHNGINGLLAFHQTSEEPAIRLNAYKYALDRLDPRFKPKSEVAQNIKDERSKLTDEQLKAEIERLDAEIAALTAGTETDE